MFALATVVAFLVIIVDQASAGAASVLLGPLDEAIILSATMLIASVALVLGLCGVASPGWMLPFKILGIIGSAVLVLCAAFFTLVSIDVSITTVLEDGCDTGYVVVERSFLMGSSGTIYRQDGPVIAAQMGRTSGDDAHQPFAAGDYTASTEDATLMIEYRPDQGGASVNVSLPVIVDRLPTCGLVTHSPDEQPQPSEQSDPLDVLTPAAADDEIRRLLDDSFAAASGTPVDASGTAVDASTAIPTLVPCVGGSGTQHQVKVEFRTDDNARSVAQILGVWGDAGYETDRAMQEDIRYSETAPVARMTIRDTTSIDGFIRMSITSACRPAQ